LAAEPLEWDTPKGEATDAHDASGSAALARTEPAAKKTSYPRRRPGQQTPTLHAATAPAASAAATGSQLPLQPASGPQAEPVQPAGVVPVQRAQAVQPAGFTFMGSASDSCCGARRPAPASARRGAWRRPAPQAARRRPGPA